MSENLVTEIKDFCDQENLSFSDDTAYDNNMYLSCVAISTINPFEVLVKLTEYLIKMGYSNVSSLLKLVDYKSDGCLGKLYLLNISKNFSDSFGNTSKIRKDDIYECL